MVKRMRTYFKKRWLPSIIAYSAKFTIKLVLWTCRVEVIGLNKFIQTAGQFPCILALWHNRLALVSEVMNRAAPAFIYTAFISNSRDGEPLARLAQSYKIGRALRVPHNLRHHALSQMIHHLKDKREILIITPDGPRGPRYEVKPGIIAAARTAEAKVVPFSWQANRVWTLNTWDQMMMPKPFSKIRITFGEPLSFEKGAQGDMQAEIIAVQNALTIEERVQ